MDYKSVIEEQIKKLQELKPANTEESIDLARNIATLCFEAKQINK